MKNNKENIKRIKELAKDLSACYVRTGHFGSRPKLIELVNRAMTLDEVLKDGVERVWNGYDSILWNNNGFGGGKIPDGLKRKKNKLGTI